MSKVFSHKPNLRIKQEKANFEKHCPEFCQLSTVDDEDFDQKLQESDLENTPQNGPISPNNHQITRPASLHATPSIQSVGSDTVTSLTNEPDMIPAQSIATDNGIEEDKKDLEDIDDNTNTNANESDVGSPTGDAAGNTSNRSILDTPTGSQTGNPSELMSSQSISSTSYSSTTSSKRPGKKSGKLWSVLLWGPDNTPYEGGLFKLSVQFGKNYPVRAPIIRFVTKIFHMNVNSTGKICIKEFADEWKKQTTIVELFHAIYDILVEPDVTSGINENALVLYVEDRETYDITATEWTKSFAEQYQENNQIEETETNKKNKDGNGDDNGNANGNISGDFGSDQQL